MRPARGVCKYCGEEKGGPPDEFCCEAQRDAADIPAELINAARYANERATKALDGNLQYLQRLAWQQAEDKGWHEEKVDPIVRLCLIHSEISEALEELRNGHDVQRVYCNVESGTASSSQAYFTADWDRWISEGRKPEGFPVEIADAFIRILDLCECEGIDLLQITKLKMRYNATRSHRHGGKTC